MKIEEMYSAHVLENDPDRKDSYPFVVDGPPRYDGDLKELVMTVSRKLIGKGITNSSHRHLVVEV